MNFKSKTLIISFLLLILFSFSSKAQYYTKFGVKATANLCGLWGPDKPDYFSETWGYGAGVFFNFPIGDNLYSVLEFNYDRRTFDFTEPLYLIDNSLLKITEKNDFIEIPLMLKLRKGDEVSSVHILFGWQASFLLKNQTFATATVLSHAIDAADYYDYKNNFYDFGFATGIGFTVKAFTLDMRYYMSMRNIHKGETIREMRYRLINLSLAYQFNYVAPRLFRKNSTIKNLKYKFKRAFK